MTVLWEVEVVDDRKLRETDVDRGSLVCQVFEARPPPQNKDLFVGPPGLGHPVFRSMIEGLSWLV